LTHSAQITQASVGQDITFTLQVTNRGPGPAANVSIVDTLAGRLTFKSASTTQGTVAHASGVVTATIGSLAAGNQATVTVVVTAASPGGATNLATASTSSRDYLPANNSASTTLTITKSGTTGIVSSSRNPSLPGEQVAFGFTLSAVPPGAGAPTGNVQFRIDGSVAGSASLVTGAATFLTSSLTVGTHTVVAEYPGDANFFGVSNSLAPVQLVNTPPVAGTDTIERYASNGTKVEISTLLANDSDADGDIVTFVSANGTSANGGTVTRDGNWIYYAPPAGFTNVDSFSYTISDGRGNPVTGTVTVRIKEDGPALNLTITDLGNGSYRLRFDGVPNRSIIVQYTPTLQPANWQTLTTGTTDAVGIFEYIDQPSGGQGLRFYRSLYP
jgi:uncharacterized repeat protein (TIGR01451 family)